MERHVVNGAKIYLVPEERGDFVDDTSGAGGNSPRICEWPEGLDDLSEADIICLFPRTEIWIHDVVRSIKSSPLLFAKPLMSIYGSKVKGLAELVDVEFILPSSSASINARLEGLGAISEKLNGFSALPDGLSERMRRELVLVRYLHSRPGRPLKPVHTDRAPVERKAG